MKNRGYDIPKSLRPTQQNRIPTNDSDQFIPTYEAGKFGPGPTTTNFASQMNQSSHSNVTYLVYFKVQKKISQGHTMAVMGCTENLGAWKTPVYFLKWTAGDIWVSEKPVVMRDRHYFQYKYAAIDKSKQIVGWERGVDRISDLIIMPDAGFNSPESSSFSQQYGQVKVVEMNDTWETFTMNLSVWNYDETFDSMTMDSLDEQYKNVTMNKQYGDQIWLDVKYGKLMRPWKCGVTQENIYGTNCGQFDRSTGAQEFTYTYIKKSYDQTISERSPKRMLLLQDPSKYDGRLGLQEHNVQINTEKVFIVNGHLEKADGNFIGLFMFKKIMDQGIILGNYPEWDYDIQKLHNLGVNGVLDIQNPTDFKQRGLNSQRLQTLYRDNGIRQYMSSAVEDFDEDDYADMLFKAACVLNRMVKEQGLTVFVHDTNGVSRVATLMMVYLALFLRHKSWNNLPALQSFVKINYPQGVPNMEMVEKVIEENKDFQNQQYKKWQEEEERRKRQAQEADRNKKAQNKNDLDEQNRLMDLVAIEKEKLRKQRLAFEDGERKRLQKIKDDDADRERRLKLMNEKYKQMYLRLLDDEADRLRKKKIADEDERRQYERNKARQLAEIEALKRKLKEMKVDADLTHQKLLEFDKLWQEDERDFRLMLEENERERIRQEQLEFEEIERVRIQRIEQHDSFMRLQKIKFAQQEAQRVMSEHVVVDESEKLKRTRALLEGEEERLRLLKFSIDEGNNLIDHLQKIEFEEAGIRPKNYQWEETNADQKPDYLNAFTELSTIGLTENDLEDQVDELFCEQPIVFDPRDESELDQKIEMLINQYDLRIPIVWVRDNLYLIGSCRMECQLQGMDVMVKSGNDWELFKSFVPDYQRYFQKQLVVYMIKSSESLTWVVDCLVNGRMIKNIFVAPRKSFTRNSFTSGHRHSFTMGRSNGGLISPERKAKAYIRSNTPKREQVRNDKGFGSPMAGAKLTDTKSALSVKRRSLIQKIQGATGAYHGESTVARASRMFDAEYNIDGHRTPNYMQRKSVILKSLLDVNRKLEEAPARDHSPISNQHDIFAIDNSISN